MTDGVRIRRWAGLAAAAALWWTCGAAGAFEGYELIGPGPASQDAAVEEGSWWRIHSPDLAASRPSRYGFGLMSCLLVTFVLWVVLPRRK